MAERFPRAEELPTQSPVFWVEQKDRYLRQLLIRDIEALTQRRLVVYFGNRYENAMIDAQDIKFLSELFRDVKNEPVDFMIESTGGFTDSAEGILALLKNLSINFRAIVVQSSKSNGTLISLAATSIVMGAPSEIGPIEPAFNGIPCTVRADPEMAKINFVLHKEGIFALNNSKNIAIDLLSKGMMAGKDPEVIQGVVQKLSSRDTYASHGSVIHHREAKEIGLTVDYLAPGNPVWERLWLLHCMYDFDCRKLRYLKIFEGRQISTAVAAPPSVKQ